MWALGGLFFWVEETVLRESGHFELGKITEHFWSARELQSMHKSELSDNCSLILLETEHGIWWFAHVSEMLSEGG